MGSLLSSDLDPTFVLNTAEDISNGFLHLLSHGIIFLIDRFQRHYLGVTYCSWFWNEEKIHKLHF